MTVPPPSLPPAPPFETKEFSSPHLFEALSNRWCRTDEVAAREHAQYLYRYLDAMGAKSIVVEREYTDGDYLEDFASYYVRCHAPYEKKCKRVHFFTSEVTTETITHCCLDAKSATENGKVSALQSSYLGFVVARPLPSAIIGRTLLKHPDDDNKRRFYPIVDLYKANLFGIQLEVPTLPYQEQDSVLAACATVAMWSAFHRTAKLFGTPAPRPAQITRAAAQYGHEGRAVPSRGLKIDKMCNAVSYVGLEPEVVEIFGHNVPLLSLAYAHLRMRLPVILIVHVEGEGLHAITLAGYSLRNTRVNAREVAGDADPVIPMVGLRIDRLYGHDDQIGPFARLLIQESPNTYPVTFTGSWKERGGGKNAKMLTLSPESVLIPVYNKVRLTFLDVQEWPSRLHNAIAPFLKDLAAGMEWDIFLSTSNDFKEEILTSSLPAETRENILFAAQPRFLWRGILRLDGTVVLEIVFDATDMARSSPFKLALWPHAQFAGFANQLLNTPAIQPKLEEQLTGRFLKFLKDSLAQRVGANDQ